MKRLLMIYVVFSCLPFFLTSCSLNHTKIIADELQPDKLYGLYNNSFTNIGARSKCSEVPSVNIVNVEKRDDKHNINPRLRQVSGFPYINPKELTNHIVDYMKIAFEKFNVKVDNKSTKIIQVSLNNAEYIQGVWGQGADVKLKIDIPEEQYTWIYGAQDSTYGSPMRAAAYAIHKVTFDIIKDPIIQDYILCKAEYNKSMTNQKEKDEIASKSLSQKLQELQTALDNGLITKEEYQLKRKVLIENY